MTSFTLNALKMADVGSGTETSVTDEGFFISSKKAKPISKDPNPETFWADFDLVIEITKLKAENVKYGAHKIANVLKNVAEKKVKKVLENYLYDASSGNVFRKSSDLHIIHRKCVTKDELINLIIKNHEVDHRKSAAIYESLRKFVFPVVRDNIKLIFDNYVKCSKCQHAVELPKTTRTRRPIPATYPNSRWQIDLKKMPSCKGYNYICNIVDCFSRYGFGKATKGKTAKEIAEIVLNYIYLFGSPRILQSDNGKEFRNSDLEGVVKEFETKQMHGRPYHPQSQGRVERFNRTMTDYFRTKMVDTSNWVDQLPEFYYSYNNRVHKSTRPATPYELYFKRPNFAAPLDQQIPYAALTMEEREFLKNAHLDVDFIEDDEDHENSGTQTPSTENPIHSGTTDDNLTLEEALEIIEGEDMNAEQETRVCHDDLCQSVANLTSKNQDNMEPRFDYLNAGGTGSRCSIDDQENSSDYYRTLYKRRFSEINLSEKENVPDLDTETTGISLPKSPFINTGISTYFQQMQKQTLLQYPLEEFSEGLMDDIEFYPKQGDILLYRTNPALNKGIAVFKSGFWKRGLCTDVKCSAGGKLYEIKDQETGQIFEVNRYQLKKL